VKVVLGLNALGIGGTESYTFTVAEHLDRLAHEAAIYSPELGPGLEVARERGLTVIGPDELGQGFDVALVQDAAVAYELAEHGADTRSVFVGHSEYFDPQLPPGLPGVVDTMVVLNDRVERRLRAFAGDHEVVRLRQPIDTERFLSPGPLPERPRRALVLSNNIVADRMAMLEEACREVGLELVRAGGAGRQTNDPREALAAADVVIGYGRGILEAMACGRAAFVYDWAGGDGWVTADTYPAIEADGFGGRGDTVLDPGALIDALGRYHRSMGPVNRDFVVAHHRANVHVQQLIEIFERLASPPARPEAPLTDMARLVRLEWRARAEVHGLRVENARLHGELHATGEALASAREEALRERDKRADEAAKIRRAYEATLSWRLTSLLRRVGGLLRAPFR
jgi:hypothetical protein